MTNRFSVGLEKRDGAWKVVHEHSSLPIDLGSGKAVFECCTRLTLMLSQEGITVLTEML